MMSIPEESQMLPMPPHNALFCTRKQREFTPDSKKDDTYWDRRRRNNAAAKRSREKRRLNDMLLEKRVIQLSRENHILRAQVQAVQQSYGIRADALIDMDQVMATLPSEDALLNMTCSPSSRLVYTICYKLLIHKFGIQNSKFEIRNPNLKSAEPKNINNC